MDRAALPATPSQTIGPYWHVLEDRSWSDLTRFGATGERITLTGVVRDGADDPVIDACVELFQASPAADERFQGFGRSATDGQGRFRFTTVRPGATTRPDGLTLAPHLSFILFARGLLHHLATRAYFAGEPLNDTDPVLRALEAGRRARLLAVPSGPGMWSFDICLQGDGETVFFR